MTKKSPKMPIYWMIKRLKMSTSGRPVKLEKKLKSPVSFLDKSKNVQSPHPGNLILLNIRDLFSYHARKQSGSQATIEKQRLWRSGGGGGFLSQARLLQLKATFCFFSL